MNSCKKTEGGTLSNSFYEVSITLTPKSVKYISRNKNLQITIPFDYTHKIPRQNNTELNPTNMKRIIHHNQVGFS